jgi:hypothetical protein
VPGTSGGWTPITEAALSTTVKTIKSSAGKIGMYYCYNPNSSVAYIQFFNTTTVTLGTTAPAYFIGIPATSGANLDSTMGLTFSTAIAVAATTTATGSTAPTSGIDCSFGYN